MTRSNWKPITQPIAVYKFAGSPHSKQKTANDPVGPTASQQNWVGRETSPVCHRSSTPPHPKELFRTWGSGMHGSSPAPKPPQSSRHAGASGCKVGLCWDGGGFVRFLHGAQQAEQRALPGCQLPRKPHTCYIRASDGSKPQPPLCRVFTTLSLSPATEAGTEVRGSQAGSGNTPPGHPGRSDLACFPEPELHTPSPGETPGLSLHPEGPAV